MCETGALVLAAQPRAASSCVRHDEHREHDQQDECCAVHAASSYETTTPTLGPVGPLHQRSYDPNDDRTQANDIERWHQTKGEREH